MLTREFSAAGRPTIRSTESNARPGRAQGSHNAKPKADPIREGRLSCVTEPFCGASPRLQSGDSRSQPTPSSPGPPRPRTPPDRRQHPYPRVCSRKREDPMTHKRHRESRDLQPREKVNGDVPAGGGVARAQRGSADLGPRTCGCAWTPEGDEPPGLDPHSRGCFSDALAHRWRSAFRRSA